MKNKTHFGSVSINEGVAEEFSLDYYLLSDGEESTAYGFEVIKKNKSGSEMEKVQVNDFVSAREIAERFLKLIVNGIVTPVSVLDISEDFLGMEYGI